MLRNILEMFYFFLTVYGWGYQDYQEGFIQQILINNPTKQNNKICHQLSTLFTFDSNGKENSFLHKVVFIV